MQQILIQRHVKSSPLYVLTVQNKVETKIFFFAKTFSAFRENLLRKCEIIGLFIRLDSPFTLRSLEKDLFYHLFINFFIFDQPCKDIPGQPGQDNRGRTALTVILGHDTWDKTSAIMLDRRA